MFTAEITMSPHASYIFRVKAVNTLGAGDPSQETEEKCQSADSKPSKNPEDVRTYTGRPGYLVVQWKVRADWLPGGSVEDKG